MTREQLERNQVWLYGVVLMLAGVIGWLAPEVTSKLDHHVLISLIIAILMYGMFTQIPFPSIQHVFSDRRFIFALLTANYVAVPIVVWSLGWLLPQEAPVLLGVYLVLLTPCIDYVIVFTQIGRGNAQKLLLATPLLFISQLLLLPLYLWLFLGESAAAIVQPGPFIEAFLLIIILPLFVAFGFQMFAKTSRFAERVLDHSAWLPVPFMAITLFVVVVSQLGKVTGHLGTILQVVPVYLLFMLLMPLITRQIIRWFRLEAQTGRAVLFSASTRNSLVVLPLALALPEEWRSLVAAIIVTQTIVELVGELIYVRWIPNRLLREQGKR
ncbi:arsenic resistance protein [Aureibacillus halotolerans]|uniref:ACR3 family arsenite efflux pump ArsB n=1 Tax=Aureibacillus halotolerans TaxID=1508390 RepID=A0A4R6U6C6_9BACI|nr:arsenic resistance protein [Aureibacillus halotolerans]TDQ41142.1 ACR3 family arsenite efflux pump ArsB [Aureibacillus halotolerans]